MVKSFRMLFTVAVVALVALEAKAFTTPRCNGVHQSLVASPTMRSMVPKYDPSKQRWASEAEDLEGSYDIFETIVRNGPLPFFQRIISADSYEQGVLKMMASEGMGRAEAQGNMDASLENAGDWAYQKMKEKNGGPKKDYAKSPSPKQFALALTWSAIVFWFFGSFFLDAVTGKY